MALDQRQAWNILKEAGYSVFEIQKVIQRSWDKTMRDEIAMVSLNSLISHELSYYGSFDIIDPKLISEMAYRVADAMIEARSKE